MQQSKNPYRHLLRTLWRYAPDKKLFVFMILFSLLSKLIRLSEPYIFGQIINTIQVEGASGRSEIRMWIIAFVCITPIFRLFHGISRVREQKIKFQAGEACMNELFYKTASLPMARQSDNHSGKTIDKTQKAVSALREFAGNNFMYLSTIMFSLGSLVSLFMIRWPAGGIILILALITVFVIWRFDKRLVTLIQQQNSAEHIVMSTLFDFLSNIKTVITLRFENRALETLKQKISAVFPFFRQFSVLNEWKRFSMDMLMSLAVFIILMSYLYQQFSSGLPILIGTITMLRQYIEKMRNAFENFTRQWGDLMQMSANFHTIDDIEQAYHHQQTFYTTSSPISTFHSLALKHLHFSYAEQKNKTLTLTDISLDLLPGKRIALVGSSGSGKSTLMMLLRGLYPVSTVSLTLDDVTYTSLAPLSGLTALIPQEPEIFEQSIRYNITMGIDIDDATVLQYCDLACFSDVLSKLPAGLDTDIKEKGVNLSGGQKQRLALARGLLMANDSPILLLDESTSSVDIHNETAIYQNIFAHFPDTCIVASIHKLHLLPKFDHIYVIEEGQIIESGSFDTLVHNTTTKLSQLRHHYHDTLDHAVV